MLETIREYGLEALRASGDEAVTRDAHAAFYCQLAAQTRPKLHGVEQGLWLDRLEIEHANLRGAFRWLAETGDWEACQRLATDLIQLWWMRNHVAEGRVWLEEALAPSAHDVSPLRAESLRLIGVLAAAQGDFAAASAYLHECLRVAQELADPLARGGALNGLGMIDKYRDDLDQAAAHQEAALQLAREVDSPSLITSALLDLAEVAYLRRDYSQALGHCEEALTICRALGNGYRVAIALGTIAAIALHQGDLRRAAIVFAEELDLAERVSDRLGVADAVNGLAGIAAASGEATRAARLLGAADAMREATGRRLPRHPPLVELVVATVRAGLGAPAFTAAWTAGRTLSQDEAVADARSVVIRSDLVTNAAVPPAAATPLTPREREVLRHLVAGKTDREIADALFISPRTAMTHVRHIFTKIGVTSRRAAAAYAKQHQLV
jgi:non-specific serine/threonine protein kinase